MKKILSVTLVLGLSFNLIAQEVSQTILVEHFTNTLCGICSSRNPGFYANLRAQSNVLHMAIHPSAPYSACVLNQQNKTENDARTQFYGIYGSTPRLVIQGNALGAAANYSSAAIFDTYKNKTTPIALNTSLTQNENSIDITVVVKSVAANSLTNLVISGFLVEEELNYAAPNGEQVHYDVFRKSIFNIQGESISTPTQGDSIVLTKTVPINAAWNLNKIYALITVQQSNKEAVQSARSANLSTPTGIADHNTSSSIHATIFPNPTSDVLNITLENNEHTLLTIYDITAKQIHKEEFQKEISISTSQFNNGLYIVSISNSQGRVTKKVKIMH